MDKQKKTASKPKNITRGVPQGSVLGPVLFILFTNDFPKYIENFSNTIMYADDTVLLLGRKTPEQLEVAANTALNMAIQYCHNSDLIVNQNKTKQLVLGKYKDTTNKLPDLEESTSSKYLGVILDESLTWTPHIDALCKKLRVGLYVIKRMTNISDTATAKVAYHAIFESHLRYGITIWGGTSNKNLTRILIIQKKAIRTLGSLKPRDSCREMFKHLKIFTVINLYIFETISYLHIKTPESARTGLQNHNYNTRHATNYSLPIHRLSATEKRPAYMGAKMWNVLPDMLKRVNNKQKFQKQLRSWLQDHPFYSLAEFQAWRTYQ